MFAMPETEYDEADAWLEQTGLLPLIAEGIAAATEPIRTWLLDTMLDKVIGQVPGRLAGRGRAEDLSRRPLPKRSPSASAQGESFDLTPEQWLAIMPSGRRGTRPARRQRPWASRSYGMPNWPRPPRATTRCRADLEYAIAKSLAAAPFADILWMETATADLQEAKEFAEAIHAEFPDKMMAYNLSPSFNWDTTGMTDEQMKQFPEELGKLGFVFNFITYGGHQIDGLAAEEFAAALQAGRHVVAGAAAT